MLTLLLSLKLIPKLDFFGDTFKIEVLHVNIYHFPIFSIIYGGVIVVCVPVDVSMCVFVCLVHPSQFFPPSILSK